MSSRSLLLAHVHAKLQTRPHRRTEGDRKGESRDGGEREINRHEYVLTEIDRQALEH